VGRSLGTPPRPGSVSPRRVKFQHDGQSHRRYKHAPRRTEGVGRVESFEEKSPAALGVAGLGGIRAWQCPTFAPESALSSALSGFTSEVGMGSGGSRSLWPPGKTGVKSLLVLSCALQLCGKRTRRVQCLPTPFGCYMVKPHGPLVSVSCIHYWTSTSDLSTWWSSRALQGTRSPGEISSWEGLPA
jgi:hypothetical protein